MEITLQGSLKSFKIPDLLTFINMSRATGTLKLSTSEKEADIYFDRGNIVYAGSNQEKFRLAAVLMRKKKMDTPQWKKIEKIMLAHKEKFGRLAVVEKILTEEELQDFLKIQVSEIIFDCFVWTKGKFSFVDVMQLPEYAVTISLDLGNLIMEGARRIDEWEHFSQLFSKNMVFHVIGNPETQDKITLTLVEWRILFLLDGKKTVEQICKDSSEEPLEIYRILFGLRANKLIEEVTEVEDFKSELPEKRGEEQLPTSELITEVLSNDATILLSPEANLTFKDILRVTLARVSFKGPEKGDKMFPLVDQEYFIGRQTGNQIHVPDTSVSNIHARIFKGPEGYVLEDLNSRNGTFVNGKPVERILLHENDIIRVGNTDLVYNLLQEVQRVPSVPAEEKSP